MRVFETLGKRKAVLGMIHLQPLPGTPFYKEGSFSRILDIAVESALALCKGGADGCLVQTVDRIYSVADESDPRAQLQWVSLCKPSSNRHTGSSRLECN